MLESFKEYVSVLLRWWWLMLVFAVGDIAGIILTVWQDIQVPFLVWILIFVVGFFIANFLIFHQLRKKRDEIKQERDALSSEDAEMERKIKQLELEEKEIEKRNRDSIHPTIS